MSMDAFRQYLSDHWTGSRTGVQLARRAVRQHPEGAVGMFLQEFLQVLQKHRSVLTDVMRVFGARASLKSAIASVSEQVSELTEALSRVVGRSPHHNFVMVLESLMMMTEGRLGLFQTLEAMQRLDPRLLPFDFQQAREETEQHRAQLERFRLQESLTTHLPRAEEPTGRTSAASPFR